MSRNGHDVMLHRRMWLALPPLEDEMLLVVNACPGGPMQQDTSHEGLCTGVWTLRILEIVKCAKTDWCFKAMCASPAWKDCSATSREQWARRA